MWARGFPGKARQVIVTSAISCWSECVSPRPLSSGPSRGRRTVQWCGAPCTSPSAPCGSSRSDRTRPRGGPSDGGSGPGCVPNSRIPPAPPRPCRRRTSAQALVVFHVHPHGEEQHLHPADQEEGVEDDRVRREEAVEQSQVDDVDPEEKAGDGDEQAQGQEEDERMEVADDVLLL